MPSSLSIKNPPFYDLFFARLAIEMSPSDLEMIGFAYFSSKYGHGNEVRDGGGRYFDHPKAVAWICIDEFEVISVRVIINALLHDILENTYLLSSYRIALNFGKEMALDLRALTKLSKGKETTEEYLYRVIERGAEVIFVKLCDRLHNLRTLGSCKPEKIERQMLETREKHIPILIPALRGCGGGWVKIADSVEKKIDEAMSGLNVE